MKNPNPLGRLVDRFQRTLWLPDPDLVYLALAAVVANRMGSPPVWLLVVGPPSSGKSEILDALSGLPEFLAVSTVTKAGLLSGSPTRDGSGATGGVLRQLGEHGLMVVSDFGTLLNEHGSTRNEVFACLREVFDGKFIRRLGTGGGRDYAWEGHAGFIGACTEAIDSPSIDLGVLGERFTYYRMPAATADDEVMACVVTDEHVGHLAEIRAERTAAVAEFIGALTLPDEFPDIAEPERDRLITLANLCATCRSSVLRDGYSRDIDLVPGHERSPRLYRQFRHLHGGLTVIGTPDHVLWNLLAKLALDGMHPGRRAVLEYLMANAGPHTTSSVAGHCRLPDTAVRRHLQDLNAHGVLDLHPIRPERWEPSQWLRDAWWAVNDLVPGSVA